MTESNPPNNGISTLTQLHPSVYLDDQSVKKEGKALLNNAKLAFPLFNDKRRIHQTQSNRRKSRTGLPETQDVPVSPLHEKNAMKIRLGPITIDSKHVHSLKRIGSRVCILQFVTGASITVVCGVKIPDKNTISFPGTPEDLEELLAEYIESNESDKKNLLGLTH